MSCGVRQAINRTAIILVLALSIYGILLVFISSSSNPVLVLSKVKSITNGIHTKVQPLLETYTATASQQESQVIHKNLTHSTINSTPRSKTDTAHTTHLLIEPLPSFNESERLQNGSVTKALSEFSNLPVSASNPQGQGVPSILSVLDSVTSAASLTSELGVKQSTETYLSNRTSVEQTPSPQPVLVTSASIRSGFTLLTMFTTFKSLPSKVHIYKNTIKNWQQLMPHAQPVLYYIPGEADMARFARDHGWATHPVPRSSEKKIPILRHMFLDAEERYKTPFYCYSNGDILFNMSLVDTLKAIQPYQAKFQHVLIVGRRSNFKLTEQQSINSLDEVTKLAKGAKLFGTNAQDYFISTFNGYPWGSIPDFVVGRVGYDNWLVVTAIAKGMKVIDTTGTLLALHQTGHDGDFAGHSKKEKRGDVSHNYKLAGLSFNYNMGHVTCSQFMTRFNKTNAIELVQRKKNICAGMYRKRKLNPYINLRRR